MKNLNLNFDFTLLSTLCILLDWEQVCTTSPSLYKNVNKINKINHTSDINYN
jgi:hypothetical protein